MSQKQRSRCKEIKRGYTVTTIIAECCQNHNGDKSILKDMIWQAAESGADIVKMQSIHTDDLTHREQFDDGIVENGKTKVIKRPYQAEFERLDSMNLSEDDHRWFIEEAKKAGIKPMTTVFSQRQVPFLASLEWDAVKLASYDCASYSLLKKLAEDFKYLYISTGATFDEEIQETANLLKNVSFSFLHCVTIYPTPLNELCLKRIDWLRQFTSSVGFSDHSFIERDGLKASIAAIYFGADIVERHFTVLPTDKTKDGPVSVTPKQLKDLVKFANTDKNELKEYIEKNIPEYNEMLGHPNRELSHNELLNRDYYRGRFAARLPNGRILYNWEEVN